MVATPIEKIKNSMLCVTGKWYIHFFSSFALKCESSEHLLLLFIPHSVFYQQLFIFKNWCLLVFIFCLNFCSFLTRMKNVSQCNDQCWPASWVIVWHGKTKMLWFLRHYKCNKCQTLHDGITHWVLPVNTTFNDLYHISRSRQCQRVLTENLMFLSS